MCAKFRGLWTYEDDWISCRSKSCRALPGEGHSRHSSGSTSMKTLMHVDLENMKLSLRHNDLLLHKYYLLSLFFFLYDSSVFVCMHNLSLNVSLAFFNHGTCFLLQILKSNG